MMREQVSLMIVLLYDNKKGPEKSGPLLDQN